MSSADLTQCLSARFVFSHLQPPTPRPPQTGPSRPPKHPNPSPLPTPHPTAPTKMPTANPPPARRRRRPNILGHRRCRHRRRCRCRCCCRRRRLHQPHPPCRSVRRPRVPLLSKVPRGMRVRIFIGRWVTDSILYSEGRAPTLSLVGSGKSPLVPLTLTFSRLGVRPTLLVASSVARVVAGALSSRARSGTDQERRGEKRHPAPLSMAVPMLSRSLAWAVCVPLAPRVTGPTQTASGREGVVDRVPRMNRRSGEGYTHPQTERSCRCSERPSRPPPPSTPGGGSERGATAGAAPPLPCTCTHSTVTTPPTVARRPWPPPAARGVRACVTVMRL